MAKSSVTVFQFESNNIRTIIDDVGDPWFVAKDVAESLGYSNTADAVRSHCRKSKSLKDLGCAQGAPLDPQTKLIPESDIYRLTMKSTLPSAEKFQDWVADDVLPSIRKTGSYFVPRTPGEALVEMAQSFLRHERQIATLQQQQAETAAQVRALVDGENFFTVVGHANLIGKRIDEKTAASIGKIASRMCKDRGIQTGSAPHPRYGTAKTYPREVCDDAFDHYYSTH